VFPQERRRTLVGLSESTISQDRTQTVSNGHVSQERGIKVFEECPKSETSSVSRIEL